MFLKNLRRKLAIVGVATFAIVSFAAMPSQAVDCDPEWDICPIETTPAPDETTDDLGESVVVTGIVTGLTTTVPMCQIGYTEPPATTLHYWYVQQDIKWQRGTRSDGVQVHRLYYINVLIKDGGGNPISRGNYFDHKLYVDGVEATKDRVRPYSTIQVTSGGASYYSGSRRWSGYLIPAGTVVTSSWVPRTKRITAKLDVVADFPYVQVRAANYVPTGYNGQYVGVEFGLCRQQFTSPFTIY